jgi:hypothetical protein
VEGVAVRGDQTRMTRSSPADQFSGRNPPAVAVDLRTPPRLGVPQPQQPVAVAAQERRWPLDRLPRARQRRGRLARQRVPCPGNAFRPASRQQ